MTMFSKVKKLIKFYKKRIIAFTEFFIPSPLLLNPPILVLDDATSAIDVQVEQKIHRALHVLLADRTTIIIAHRLATISLADRVVLVENGTVIATGTHRDLLLHDPRYAEVLARVSEEHVDDDVMFNDEGVDL